MGLREKKQTQSLFVAGMLFLVLGLGNTIYGHEKYREYKKIYSKALIEISEITSKKENKNPMLSSSNAFIEKERHLKRSHGRITFYKFFVVGGSIFIGISIFFLLWVWIRFKASRKYIQEDSHEVES